MPGRVLLIEDNLFLRAKIEGALRGAGYEAVVATTVEAARSALAGGVLAVLVDLGGRVDWQPIVAGARAGRPERVAVIGYGPHTDEALLERGLAGGCDEVVPNGLIAGNPGAVLKKHDPAR